MIGILGGGLTGLMLGSLIPDSEILEKEDVVGGLCRSKLLDGFTYDIGGSHVLFSRNREIMKRVEAILEGNIERRRRDTKVFYKDRFIKYPFENGLSDLPLEDNFECLYGYIESYYARKSGKAAKPQNFKEWMFYRFGKGITEKYLLPYNNKIWKMDASQMSLGWIEGRVPDPSVKDIIKSSLGFSTEGYTHQLNFIYPRRGGIQALTDRLAERCGSIITGFMVRKVRRDKDGFHVSDAERTRHYDRLISTIPLPSLIRCLEGVPEKVIESSERLGYNSLISVFLGIAKPSVKKFSWVYFPDDESLFHRVSFPSNYSPEVAPDGHASILAEITCHEGDEIWNKSDEDIVRHVVDRLDEIKIIRKDDVLLSNVSRITPAYVKYDLDHDANMKVVNDYLSKTGIDTCGRFGEFKYLNMDACIRNAIALASNYK